MSTPSPRQVTTGFDELKVSNLDITLRERMTPPNLADLPNRHPIIRCMNAQGHPTELENK